MVTQRDTQRRAQPQGQGKPQQLMRPAKRQLLNENSLPIPSIPPTVVPPPAVPSQRSQPTSKNDLPYPPHVPPLNAEGNPMGHLVPNVAAAEPSMLRDRYNSNNPYVVEAKRLAKEYGLPENIFLALIHQESRFDANALSPAGAIGLTQLMPGTASDMGVDPRDPMQNLEGGARYLAQQYKAFGEWPLALAAYNAGPSRVRKAGNVIPDNKETQNYVPTVLHNAGVAGYADGGLIELARKYADGGSVAGAAQVYDPAVIAAIAASITEPQGYAEGGRAASKKKNQNRPLSLDLSDSSYDGYKPYPTNTPDPKKWSPAPVPKRNDQDLAASSSLTKTGEGAFWEGLRKASPELALGMGSGEMGQGEVDAGESSAEGGNDALGFKIRGNVGKLGSSPYVNIGGGITLPLGDVMLMLDASYGKAIGYSAKPDISVTGGVRIPFADGGTTTGVSSDDATPRTFADLVRRYAVGDAMRNGGPTARQRPPTYEEMGNNPVGWSSVYPPQYMSNQDPNVSPVASRTLMSDAQRLGLLGRRGPVTGADLPALEARGQGLMDNAMTVAGAVNPVGIRAFHSSPHKFDQFDMSKIGTGEGAQVYGHGLYAADSPAVSGRGGNYDKQFTARTLGKTGLNQAEERVLTMLGEGQSELNILRDMAKNGATFDEANSILNRVQSAKSNIYEVNLRTHPDRLLDWDKPLAGQPAIVQDLARSADLSHLKPGNRTRRMIEMWREGAEQPHNPATWHTFHNAVSDYGGQSNPALSETLRKSGIDGIRYLDGGSRAAGTGSSNYVIFDDKLIDLLRRYGLLGMVGGGAAAAGNKNKQAPAEEQTDYAQGGSVDSAPVYDPAVIAAIAASITEDNHA